MSWFKNLQIYRLTAAWTLSDADLEAKLAPFVFSPGNGIEQQTQGWMSPRENDKLVHTVGRQILIKFATEKKLLPKSVINQVARARAAELEEQQGFAPGRKQMRELKEKIEDELLPRAFSIQSSTLVWIDPVNGWLIVDAASPAKADAVFKLLLKSLDKLPVESLRVERSPQTCMTDWLASDQSPHGFTIDQDTELRARGESKAAVRYVRHSLEAQDVQQHIAAGKQCTRLAMTWNSRVSFVLTESLAIKRIQALDILKENTDNGRDEQERFDADFTLMAAELAKLLADVVEALGGPLKQPLAA